MLQKPRLKEQYRALLVEDRGVLLLSDQVDHILPARLYDQMVPLLDGLTSTDELVEHFQEQWEPADIWCALWLLERQGCVIEAVSDSVPAAAQDPSPRPGDLPASPTVQIAVSALGQIPEVECRAALEARGLVLDDVAGVSVVLTDSYLRPELAELNIRFLRSASPWLLARPIGSVIWIGPLFRPHEGCCWRCLEDRLRRNRPFEYHLLRKPDWARPLLPERDGTAAMPVAMAQFAGELASRPEYLAGDDLTNTIVTIDTSDGCRRLHQVIRRPQCPACGNPRRYPEQAAAPFTLKSQLKRFTDGGACRAVCARETLATYQPLLDPLVGVIHDLERLGTKERVPLSVYVARYGTDPAHGDRALLECGLHRGSGKGMTDVEARTSSMGEAIERYSGVFQGDEPRILASLAELGLAAIHPNLCMQFSEAQYGGQGVPPPLEPNRRLEWTPIWSLSRERWRYLPTMFLYSGYPADPRGACCVVDPSGSAAGNSREEAVLQGLMELIERDSLALWWYNRVTRPAVDLGDIADPYCLSLRAHYRSLGREFWVLDITSDLGVPSFAAVSRRTDSGFERIVLGFGAHLDAYIAFSRALAEMDQVLTVVTAAERDGTLSLALGTWLRGATILNQPYLAPGPFMPTRLHEMPRVATQDIAEDVRVCERLLARHDMELLLLDQTRPDIEVPVVKVVVPGLRHFRARFAPGRLYTAPVEAGWLEYPNLETELNPIEFFL